MVSKPHKNSTYIVWKTSNGVIHNEHGPALVYHDGSCIQYFFNGKLHRLDGPTSIIYEIPQWFINGYLVTHPIYKWAREMDIDIENLTEEDRCLIQIKWGDFKGVT